MPQCCIFNISTHKKNPRLASRGNVVIEKLLVRRWTSTNSAKNDPLDTSFLIISSFLQFIDHPTYNDKDGNNHYPDSPAAHVHAEFLPFGQLLFDRVRNLYFLVDRHFL